MAKQHTLAMLRLFFKQETDVGRIGGPLVKISGKCIKTKFMNKNSILMQKNSDQSNSGRKEIVKPPCAEETEGQESRSRRDHQSSG